MQMRSDQGQMRSGERGSFPLLSRRILFALAFTVLVGILDLAAAQSPPPAPDKSALHPTQPGADTPTIRQGVLNASRVNLRSEPVPGAPVIATLDLKGIPLNVMEQRDGWLKVAVGGREGWVKDRFVTIAQGTASHAGEQTSSTQEPPKKDPQPAPGIGKAATRVDAGPADPGPSKINAPLERMARVEDTGKKAPSYKYTETQFQLPEEVRGPILDITLKEAIGRALEKSYELIVEKYAVPIAATDAQREESNFDPTFSIGTTKTRSEAREAPVGEDAPTAPAATEKLKGSTELSKKLETGTKLALVYESADARKKGESDRFETGVSLKLTQSLLKNFGRDVNLAKLWIARKGVDQSYMTFRKKVADLTGDVQEAYWEVQKNRKSLEVRKESYDLTKALLEKKKIEARLGAIAPLELLEIESDVSSKVTEYIEAQKSLRESETKLKWLLDLPIHYEEGEVRIYPVDRPEVIRSTPDSRVDWESVFKMHPERQKLTSQKEAKELEVMHYRNQMLPDLEAEVSYGFNKIKRERERSLALYQGWDASMGKEKDNLEVVLKLTYPIGNNAAEADLVKRKLELRKAEAEIRKQELTIRQDIVNALITLDQSRKIVTSSKENLRIKEMNLRAGEQKLKYGTSGLRDFLDTQTAFIEARLKLLTSEIELQKATARYYKAQGICDPSQDIGVIEDPMSLKQKEEE